MPGFVLGTGPDIAQFELLLPALEQRHISTADREVAEGVVGEQVPFGVGRLEDVFDAVDERVKETAEPRNEGHAQPQLQVARRAQTPAQHRPIGFELQQRIDGVLVGGDFVGFDRFEIQRELPWLQHPGALKRQVEKDQLDRLKVSDRYRPETGKLASSNRKRHCRAEEDGNAKDVSL